MNVVYKLSVNVHDKMHVLLVHSVSFLSSLSYPLIPLTREKREQTAVIGTFTRPSSAAEKETGEN